MVINVYNVFVYGSLKKGFGNHGFLSQSEFLGEAVTVESRFKMVSLGSFPGVYDTGSDKIKGEIYSINQYTLRNLDRLESEGSFYSRRTFSFELSSGEIIDARIYILLDDFSGRSDEEDEDYDDNSTRTAYWSEQRKINYI